jgi:hypothetical protein
MLNSLAMDFLSSTCFTRFLDDFSGSTASITHTLHLLEYSGCEHVFYDFDASATALVAADDVFGIFGADSRTVFADDVFLDLDLDVATVVELA